MIFKRFTHGQNIVQERHTVSHVSPLSTKLTTRKKTVNSTLACTLYLLTLFASVGAKGLNRSSQFGSVHDPGFGLSPNAIFVFRRTMSRVLTQEFYLWAFHFSDSNPELVLPFMVENTQDVAGPSHFLLHIGVYVRLLLRSIPKFLVRYHPWPPNMQCLSADLVFYKSYVQT